MTNETLTLILASLTAFFTLITGALAIAVTIGILYFKKLASDRQREIAKLRELQSEVVNRIKETEKVIQDLGVGKGDILRISKEIDMLKNEYYKIRNYLYPPLAIPPTQPYRGPLSYNYQPSIPSIREGSLTVEELQAQIQELLTQLSDLQKQLEELVRDNAKQK